MPRVPCVDLDTYKHQLIERFSNAGVRDTVPRLCAESSDRIPKCLLPVVRENLAAGRDVRLSAAMVASWARYAEGLDEQGRSIVVVDRLKDTVTTAAGRQLTEPPAFISNQELFGDLADDERFTEPYLATLGSLHQKGSRATLHMLVEWPAAASRVTGQLPRPLVRGNAPDDRPFAPDNPDERSHVHDCSRR